MNVSVTNACNRRCAYCFQKGWYLSKKANAFDDDSVIEMPVGEFETLCAWAKGVNVVKLMGGEPLLHSDVAGLITAARKKHKALTFISNISAEPERLEPVLKECAKDDSAVHSFLINTDYPASQEDVFKKNLAALCGTRASLAFSTTLLPGAGEIDKARRRIEELAAIYRAVRATMEGFRVRLAPFCPNPADSAAAALYDFTDDIIAFVNSLYPTGIAEYGFDCPVNLCEMRSDFVDACRKIGTQIRTERCSPEQGMPFDILVDHSVIWCSSANFLRLNDWRDYPDFHTAKAALSEQYYAWWRSHDEDIACRQCEKHRPGYCAGFCIAKTADRLREQGSRKQAASGVIPIHEFKSDSTLESAKTHLGSAA